MAKKSASHAHETPPAMDYAQHQATWNAFTFLVKWSIIGLGILLVSLYFFIVGGQPLVGGVLLLALIAGAVWLMVARPPTAG